MIISVPGGKIKKRDADVVKNLISDNSEEAET